MADLAICTYLWGNKYDESYVEKLAAGLKRHMKEEYRFICISDKDVDVPGVINYKIPEVDRYLLERKGCFARLRLFDPRYQAKLGLTGRVVSIDLDVVVCGDLYPLFYRSESFMILQGANAKNPCPYNGSLWMIRAGYRPDVWNMFSTEAAEKVPAYEFSDDQGWLHWCVPNASGWRAGSASGVYAFRKPGWPPGADDLPEDARLVCFPGWRDPSQFTDVPWIGYHWAA